MGAPSRSFFIEDGVFQADHCPLLLFNIEIDYFCYSIKIVFNVMNSISLAMIQNGHRAINVTNTYCLQVFDWNNSAHFRVLINMFIYKLIHCAWPSEQHTASHINSGLARDPPHLYLTMVEWMWGVHPHHPNELPLTCAPRDGIHPQFIHRKYKPRGYPALAILL